MFRDTRPRTAAERPPLGVESHLEPDLADHLVVSFRRRGAVMF